jgi:hypothetical protein
MGFFSKQHASRPIKYQNLAYGGSASVPSTNFGPSIQHILDPTRTTSTNKQ